MIKLAAEFETDGETSSMATLSMAVLGLGILAARCDEKKNIRNQVCLVQDNIT